MNQIAPFRAGDDDIHVFDRIVIATTPAGALRAIFVVTTDEGIGGPGVISTLDPDAGTWYVDEPTRTKSGMPQCTHCSRFGHRDCFNQGVAVDPLHFKRRRERDAYHAAAAKHDLRASS